MKKKLAFILGIRPDVIRASIILELLRKQKRHEICFIWSGQHYSYNLKDVFFRELGVRAPQIELKASGTNDAELVASVITRLAPVIGKLKPEAAVFLGDTNTVMGCIAACQDNCPVVHIEGCMRSYDWRMPEEKYRTIIDHCSDVIYAYFNEYKRQGVAEGLNPGSIVVTGNPIVDVLERFYFKRKRRFDALATQGFFLRRKIHKNEYFLMTCHRRENVQDHSSLEAILSLAAAGGRTVFFPASYRTQKILKERRLRLPPNVVMVDPVGYNEMLVLMVNSCGIITDSGTVVEEAAVLQVPTVQMRRSTERPQVYDCRSSVKFDPSLQWNAHRVNGIISKFESLRGTLWKHCLGDGSASQRIAADLLARLDSSGFRRHEPSRYHLDISRSFRGDGL